MSHGDSAQPDLLEVKLYAGTALLSTRTFTAKKDRVACEAGRLSVHVGRSVMDRGMSTYEWGTLTLSADDNFLVAEVKLAGMGWPSSPGLWNIDPMVPVPAGGVAVGAGPRSRASPSHPSALASNQEATMQRAKIISCVVPF